MSKTNRFTGELPAVHPFLGYEVPIENFMYRQLFFGKNVKLVPVIPMIVVIVKGLI